MPLTSVHSTAIIRDGYKPFSRTIGDAIEDKARENVAYAWLRDMLDDMTTQRRRNHEHGGSCDNCGSERFLASMTVGGVNFDLCRGCRKLDPVVLLGEAA